jgi:hypothetical protein
MEIIATLRLIEFEAEWWKIGLQIYRGHQIILIFQSADSEQSMQ